MKFSNTKTINFDKVLNWAENEFILGGQSIHGPDHWEKVLNNATTLAEQTPGADLLVVQLFSLLHDCRRRSDKFDPEHGKRAAEGIRGIHGHLFHLEDNQLDLLIEACTNHTAGFTSNNPTIGCCWDADRLELPRVGITLNLRFFSTDAARRMVAGGESNEPYSF